jgi:hypothetical protein
MKNYSNNVLLKLRITYNVYNKIRKYLNLFLTSHKAIIETIFITIRFNLYR